MAASLLPTCFSSVFSDQRATEDATCKSGTEAMADGIPRFVIQLMKSEKARLQTFSSWPFTDPQDLAEAGLFCVGRSDRVQCFCCGGTLNARDLKDNAWEEHSRSFPHCFFILGHNVGNVPLQMDEDEESDYTEKDCPPCMKTLTGRLGTFNGVQHPVDPKRLAEAGFYSTGKGDKVVCFTCGGGLENWKRQHDPFQQHAKQYPGCRFLVGKKGQEFINNIQLQKHKQQRKCAVIIRNVSTFFRTYFEMIKYSTPLLTKRGYDYFTTERRTNLHFVSLLILLCQIKRKTKNENIILLF
ncbi:E3 ubiquitin-protein ligase XIAP isoform X1 [Oryzias melastigma]|uniref:E3 ubiquitin-protein ligase XIAP isoform X1 n=1 Tax=Oryzias melastigma TaxID=30732 RepID=UPI00168CFEDC|nr:E3 ubiquitin-protein ligase XIAP isoform X1 [Oryzias melastigma]